MDGLTDSGANELQLDRVCQLICLDQCERWRGPAEIRRNAETYMRSYPGLAERQDLAVDIIYNEFLLRRQAGESPNVAEFLERFSEFREPLERQFLLHDAADSASLGQLIAIDSPRTAPQALVGMTLGDCRIVRLLGSGSTGTVYKAVQLSLRRDVALKVLNEKFRGTVLEGRFRRECLIAGQVQHPAVVATFDAGEYNGVPYLMMQYVAGETLRDLVSQNGPLPAEQVIDYIRQAASGLAHIHALGFVHRDVKPSNLILDAHGCVRVLDLGLARFDSDKQVLSHLDESKRLTVPDEFLGTVDFMAPEQARAPENACSASDVYSLGCAMYTLLTGRPPYSERSLLDRVEAHQNETVPSITDRLSSKQRSVDGLLKRMTAAIPEDRVSMLDVESLLQQV